MAISVFYIVLSYVAVISFVTGTLYKVYLYAVIPSPLTIPTTPAPMTRTGVILRMARELFFFESLFKGAKWVWLGGYLFHISLALILVRHLRYFLNPVPVFIGYLDVLSVAAGVVMFLALFYLYARRLYIDRVEYISLPADYIALWLLILIAVTGLLMKFAFRVDIVAVKLFVMGLMSLNPVQLPTDPIFLIHYTLVLVLLIYFPYSKLIHMVGIFFSPTRTQVDNPRDVRRVNPWAGGKE